MTRPWAERRLGLAGRLAAVALLAWGCTSPRLPAVPSTAPSTAPAVTLTPAATGPSSSASPRLVSPTASVPTVPGTTLVDVPEAGIRLPVPLGWEPVRAAALTDPTAREALAGKYPGAASLLDAIDELGGRARPVFLAIDPTPASASAPISANVAVLVSQPSVGGFLLDVVSGFIEEGLTRVLGATERPERDRVELPAGEAIRLRYAVPPSGGEDMVAVAWVIGGPTGTLLVTLMGDGAAMGEPGPDAIAGGIEPLADAQP